MKTIQSVADAMLCSNCGACKAICPKDAISFRATNIGRLYAHIDDEKCVECGLCVKACPSVQVPQGSWKDPYVGQVLSVQVGRAVDDKIYKNAQSGGVCTALLSYLFDTSAIDGALVCRMRYGYPPIVESVLVTDKSQLAETQKSCYTPVDLLSRLREARKYKSLAVVGLPCHIQGVANLMKASKLFANITYRIGLICERTLCGSIQDVLLSFVKEGEYKIDWKRKDFTHGKTYYPYKTAPVVVYDKSLQGGVNVMPNLYRFALKDMFTSPRCRVCFDKLNTYADIVLGDPWMMRDIDWKHGSSLLIARTDKGFQLMKQVKMAGGVVDISRRDLCEVYTGQHVDERRKQIAVYSRALSVLPVKTTSYLYEQEASAQVKQEEVEKASSELKAFLLNERLSKAEIVRKARKLIKKRKLQQSLLYRALRKIKRTIIR